jgi:hypothetical protein
MQARIPCKLACVACNECCFLVYQCLSGAPTFALLLLKEKEAKQLEKQAKDEEEKEAKHYRYLENDWWEPSKPCMYCHRLSMFTST